MKKFFIIFTILIVGIGAGLLYFFVFHKNLKDKIVIPYIVHQKPRIDPHIPSCVPVADKLDEVLFDGIFNISANPSGIIYEDGLGELLEIDENNVVSIRLKPRKPWHRSYNISMEKNKVNISKSSDVLFTAKDLKFTLRRIKMLGSLSPDFILVSQALEQFDFSGPDEENIIRLKFRDDRIWIKTDIKEVLSFKILPYTSDLNAAFYHEGTGPYILAGQYEETIHFYKNPSENAQISELLLRPYVDNSTFTTELKNNNINSLLSTPFGSISPILMDTSDYFYRSNISTVFFALFYNFERLSHEQRIELRKLVDNRRILDRFFKVNTQQQRHIADYKGNVDNYNDYLNYSIFPSTSYYVDDKVVMPLMEYGQPDLSILPDTIRIQTCLNYGFREELSEIAEIMNDPSLYHGKIKVSAVKNSEIRNGYYDAVLVPVSGYRSNFLFDLYEIFLRAPDFASYRVNLITEIDSKGNKNINHRSFTADKNFFRLDLENSSSELESKQKLLEYIYSFMSTHEIGDKQAYAQFIDEMDQEMALGSWLFSLPSMAYFSTQFNDESIDLYGVASQLSTIEKWRESIKKKILPW